MNQQRKERITRAVFVLNGFLFLLGGVGLLNDGKIVFGIAQIIASVLNFGMLSKFRKTEYKYLLELLILVVNVIVCVLIAIDYIQMGKMYIQYMWIIAAIISTIALIVKLVKDKPLS